LVENGTGKYKGNITTNGDTVPGSDLDKWVKLCTNGNTDQAKNCEINDDKRADFAVYTIDHRIQKTMDEPLPAPTTATNAATTPTSTVPSGTAKTCSENYLKYSSQSDLKRIFGSTQSAVESQLVSVDFPFKSGTKKIKFHKKAAPCLEAVAKDLATVSYKPTTFDGSFVWRPNRNNSSELSMHSFGIALDLDAARNPNGGGSAGHCITTFPPDFVAVFKKYGFRWGGAFKSNCDAMHFEWMGGS
jgi:hypothetical protein